MIITWWEKWKNSQILRMKLLKKNPLMQNLMLLALTQTEISLML